MPSRIQIAKADIVEYFDSLNKNILDHSEINTILEQNRRFWRLAQSMSCSKFVEFLVKNSKLQVVMFNFPHRGIIKYVWGEVSLYEIVLSLKPNCYLTHYTAMHYHQLTDQVPKIINVNAEQKAKSRYPSTLEQGRIDYAFNKPTRLSNNIVEYKGYTIRLLNGVHTGNIGVVELPGPEGETLRITEIERTLIDIAVRPEYSGGVFEVLQAYRRANDKISVNRLSALLKSIDYVYPYHQVIGFYLEKAGTYKKSQIALFRRFDVTHDFYLMHQIKEPEYSRQWRLFYPKGLS
jgi:hypothetical protein